MKLGLRISTQAALVGFVLLAASVASGSDFSKALHAAFDNQMGREPSGSELYYHANVNRGQGPLENYILMCGSDDYFVNQAQRNLEVYVTRLYQTFLGRNPRPDEVRFWVTQFQQGRVSRVAIVRQFCQTNHVTQLPSFAPSQPVFQVPATAPEIAAQLVAKVNLFVSLVQGELGNSYYGQNIVTQSRSLLSVAEQYRQLLQSSGRTGQQVQIAADNVERALQVLEQEYRRVPGASSHCQIVLQQISQLVTAARGASNAWASQTTPRLPTAPVSSGVAQVFPPSPASAGVDMLLNSVRQFAYGVQAYKDQSPFYSSLYRDVQGLSVQIEALELLSRQGQRSSRMRDAMTSIQNQANNVSQKISQADMRVQQGWWNIQHQLSQVAGTLGIRGTSWVAASQPVVLNRPAWNHFPFQHATRHPSNRNQDAIALADQLLSKINGYVNSLRPVASRKRDAAALFGSVQNLQHSVLAFRSTAAAGAYGTRLQRSADSLMTQYQQTAVQATQVIARDPTLNSPLFMQIGELVQKIRYAVRGVQP